MNKLKGILLQLFLGLLIVPVLAHAQNVGYDKGKINGENVWIDTSEFVGNLTEDDDNVQKVAEAVDLLLGGGGGSGDSVWYDAGSSIELTPSGRSESVVIENDLSSSNTLFVDASENSVTIGGGANTNLDIDGSVTMGKDLTMSGTGETKIWIEADSSGTPTIYFWRGGGDIYYKYRMKVDSGYFQIQVTTDGGDTWSTVWEFQDDSFAAHFSTDVNLNDVLTTSGSSAYYNGVEIGTGGSSTIWSETDGTITTQTADADLHLDRDLTIDADLYADVWKGTSSEGAMDIICEDGINVEGDLTISNDLTVTTMFIGGYEIYEDGGHLYWNGVQLDN